MVPQVEKWFQDGELDMTPIKPKIGTIMFHEVGEVMDERHLEVWDGQGLRDKLVQSPSMLDHTTFEDTDRLMSMLSVKSKTFYYHVARAQCINSSLGEHSAGVTGMLQAWCQQPNTHPNVSCIVLTCLDVCDARRGDRCPG